VRVNEELTAFLELEAAIRAAECPQDCRGRKIRLDKLSRRVIKRSRLRHPTFQRIFGRAEEARGAGPSLGPPLSAISRSNWSPESAESEAAVQSAF